MRSEQTGELAKALALAQAAIKPPSKGRTAQIKSDKGAYSYKYADLSDVIECVRKPLADNHLAITQTMGAPDGHIILTTTLLHGSGQWVDSEYPIAMYTRPQEQGSAITYARRYAVTALLGIAAEEDDDGAAAQDGQRVERVETPPPPATGDAAIILEMAANLAQVTGKHPDDIIREASKFTGRDGVEKSFTDPRKERSGKWLGGVRDKLEREWRKSAALEPGAAEAAAEFTEMFGGNKPA